MKVLVALVVLSCACAISCATVQRPAPPFVSANGFAFQVYDGTGTYDSRTTMYTPQQCGTSYDPIQINLSQRTFEEIQTLVDANSLWDATVEPIEGCKVIDVALPPNYFHFETNDKNATWRLEQCQRIKEPHAQYFEAIRKLVRLQSDQYKIVAPKCFYF